VREIETDYLVVGAGAAGMAFVDALIAACDADVVLVDRRHRPVVTGMTRIRSCACTARRRCTA
jgi:cation diffusion facilitator CzcD-associated flavoprotein CzcO